MKPRGGIYEINKESKEIISRYIGGFCLNDNV